MNGRRVGAVAAFVLGWCAVGVWALVFGNVTLWVLQGHRMVLPVWRAAVWPALAAVRPWDVASAYGPAYASALRWPVDVLLAVLTVVAVVTVVRRKHLWERRKDPLTLPLSKRARPRASMLGIWEPRPRKHPVASAVARLVEPRSQGGSLFRSNGMMVDAGGEQPGDRILLGYTEYTHLWRRRRYYVYARGDHHVAVFGPSGTGKGVSQMNPSMLFWNGQRAGSPDGCGMGWPGPLITSTVKNGIAVG